MVFRRPVVLWSLLLLIVGVPIGALQPPFRGTQSGSPAENLPLAAVNGPQKTLVILVDFSDKGNSTSPSQIGGILGGLNDYYREDSTVSCHSIRTSRRPRALGTLCPNL